MDVMKVIKQGVWILDDGIRAPVRVIGLDYDFWYQERSTRNAVSDDETPLPLGEGGFLYYVYFPEVGDSLANQRVDTEAFPTPGEGITEAVALVGGDVEWFR
jgi:hypothetical protein